MSRADEMFDAIRKMKGEPTPRKAIKRADITPAPRTKQGAARIANNAERERECGMLELTEQLNALREWCDSNDRRFRIALADAVNEYIAKRK